jgi:hypothetical protein
MGCSLLPDTFWGLTPAGWTAIGALATAFLVAVGIYQIRAIRREALKSRTLEVCGRYIMDPVLDATLHRLRKAKFDGTLEKEPQSHYTDIRTLLNYLDNLAVGAHQGLYIEKVLRDHMHPVVIAHVTQYLVGSGPSTYGLNVNNYQHLLRLHSEWSPTPRPKTWFRDGSFSILRKW